MSNHGKFPGFIICTGIYADIQKLWLVIRDILIFILNHKDHVWIRFPMQLMCNFTFQVGKLVAQVTIGTS